MVSPEEVLGELAAIGFARATNYLSVRADELVFQDTENLTGTQAAAIASIERTSNGIRLKFYDKLKALELLGKHLKLFDGETQAGSDESNLLEAIVKATQEVIPANDIPELQQTADPGDDLVESSRSEKI